MAAMRESSHLIPPEITPGQYLPGNEPSVTVTVTQTLPSTLRQKLLYVGKYQNIFERLDYTCILHSVNELNDHLKKLFDNNKYSNYQLQSICILT